MANITCGQRFVLISLCNSFIKGDPGSLYLLSHLLDKDIKSIDQITPTDWKYIRDFAYPDWKNNNWEIGKEFSMRCSEIKENYESEIMRQLKLF